ncbi:response regulator [Sedimenticola selenatireducens]|uniref:Response regulator n=1 Tax=Sedimenticola selenatireducens TaxID=191960 RepID=A0A557S3A6_9GAMM|nr:response regulator [Sedimenticola selenatireducens]TVO71902.1 response regulator [Sedimenticola selenatireducens]TVT66282.1 MAG: response regulator [Sedimenticola selenatireducens]
MVFAEFRRLFQRNRTTSAQDRRVNRRVVPTEGTTVLIVDDSRTVRRVMGTMLRQSGYKTLEAEDGAQGIELARAHKPNLIFMDVMMPGMDGFQATRKLQTHVDTQDIPVIIISGNKQATVQTWVEKIGARDFMAKPFERGEFFQRLENVIY